MKSLAEKIRSFPHSMEGMKENMHPCYLLAYENAAILAEQWERELAEAMAALRQDHITLRKLLCRIAGWDHMDTAADGPYWKAQIDAALAGKAGE